MIRKLLFPALAAALLAGCMTSGYQYRGGSGDYYYGQPSTQYRYYGAPYGSYGYGYPGGWGGSIGYGYYSNGYYPYGYYGYGGGYPYYRYPYRPPVVIVQPDPGSSGGGGDGSTDQGGHHTDRIPTARPNPPWRDLGNVPGRPAQTGPTHTGTVRMPGATGSRAVSAPQRPVSMPKPPPPPRINTGSRSGTVTGGIVRPGMAERDKRRKPTP